MLLESLVSNYYEMEEKHRASLDACLILLRRDLEPKKILPHLVSKKILDRIDAQKIKGKDTREESCEELLEMLPRKGPNAFQEFVKALKKVQLFLAESLEAEGNNNELKHNEPLWSSEIDATRTN